MSTVPKFAEVNVGDSIPALLGAPISRLQLACDHNPIHVDDDAAKAAKLDGVIAHGMLNMALLGSLVSGWASQKNLRYLNARFVSTATVGDQITCRGKVVAKDQANGENLVQLEITAENQRSEIVQKGSATVALP
jgi:acyl dehydratase